MRRIEGDGFGGKVREWNKPEQLEQWRALWAELVNDALEIAGQEQRVDHRSLEAQGIDRLPQIHLGLAVTEMRRRGITTERAELAQQIATFNIRLGFCAASRRIAAWTLSFWRPFRPSRASPYSLLKLDIEA